MKISPPRKGYQCLCKRISTSSLILKCGADHLRRGAQQGPSLPDARLAYQITQVTMALRRVGPEKKNLELFPLARSKLDGNLRGSME